MFDYLSEITMSLLTAAKAKKPEFGYAPDFVLYALGPHLKQIQDKGILLIIIDILFFGKITSLLDFNFDINIM